MEIIIIFKLVHNARFSFQSFRVFHLSLFQKSNAILIVKTMINVMSHLTGAFPPFLLFHRFLKWIKIM